MGLLLTQSQYPHLPFIGCDPHGQTCPVGIAGLYEIAKGIRHLVTESKNLLLHGPPAVGERAEPVPQVSTMPGTLLVAGKLPVEIPGIAGLFLGSVPLLCHCLQDGRYYVLAANRLLLDDRKKPQHEGKLRTAVCKY